MQEYLESVMERERWSEQMKVKDPRSQEENLQASSLLNLVLVRTHIKVFYLAYLILNLTSYYKSIFFNLIMCAIFL